MIPILNKTYYYFDDGKIRPSRRSEVVIKEIIPFNEIDSETLDMWEKEVEICDWLYEKTTDYFIKAQEVGSTNDEMVFVRVKNNGWFSLGFCAGRLDIDGTLNEICEKQFEPKERTFTTDEMDFIKRCIKVVYPIPMGIILSQGIRESIMTYMVRWIIRMGSENYLIWKDHR